MGGRGASSGTSHYERKDGTVIENPYGSQYHSVMTSGNIKFVSKSSRRSEPLMETMTKGRVYAHVEGDDMKSIVYFDNENKRTKQIDLDHPHRPFFLTGSTHTMAIFTAKTIRKKARQTSRRKKSSWWSA
ncbi:hypothetical protein [Slackia piriformis]|uniref:hypothetical protein n=1 Tax=Slackia piriformis TaxID=626934 RepID=UPI0032C101FC